MFLSWLLRERVSLKVVAEIDLLVFWFDALSTLYPFIIISLIYFWKASFWPRLFPTWDAGEFKRFVLIYLDLELSFKSVTADAPNPLSCGISIDCANFLDGLAKVSFTSKQGVKSSCTTLSVTFRPFLVKHYTVKAALSLSLVVLHDLTDFKAWF